MKMGCLLLYYYIVNHGLGNDCHARCRLVTGVMDRAIAHTQGNPKNTPPTHPLEFGLILKKKAVNESHRLP